MLYNLYSVVGLNYGVPYCSQENSVKNIVGTKIACNVDESDRKIGVSKQILCNVSISNQFIDHRLDIQSS